MIKTFIYKLRDIISHEGFSYDKIVIILVACGIITYMLTPSYNLPGVIYQENDIVISDVIVEQDTLLEDEYATNLKKENLIKDIPIYMNYFPEMIPELIKKLELSFKEANQALEKIAGEKQGLASESLKLTEEHVTLNSDISQSRMKIQEYGNVKKYLTQNLSNARKSGLTKETISGISQQIKRVNSLISFHTKNIEKLKTLVDNSTQRKITWQDDTKKMDEDIRAKQEKVIRDFSGKFNIMLSEDESRQLIATNFTNIGLAYLTAELKKYANNEIVDSSILENSGRSNNLYISKKGDEEPVIEKFYNIDILQEIREKGAENILTGNLTADNDVILVAAFLFQKVLPANLSVDRARMDEERSKLNNDTDKVYISLEKGSLLAKRGQRLDAKLLNIVNEYYKFIQGLNIYPLIIGILLLSIFMFGIMFIIFNKIKMLYNSRYKNITMIAIICTFHVSINYLMYRIMIGLASYYPYFNTNDIAFFGLPVALASMLTAILIGFEASLVVTLVSSVFVSIMFQGSGVFGLFYALISGIFAAYILDRNYSRIDLLLQGIKVSLFNVPLAILCLLFYKTGDYNLSQVPFFLSAPLISGIASSVFAMFLYPVLEVIFDITTDLKLLELSHIHHPALKNLMVNAPGSYQHSIMVGTLAEAGAIKVGGNSLLCRVAAYYHDIGKTNIPEYFIENVNTEIEDGHKKLDDPYQSAEKIISHVSEGTRIAKQYNLGKSIIDMIAQHHGTSLSIYFYNKAIERALAEGKPASSVDKQLFCYPGPKPQNIEAAIVMLADSCEAATRSLSQPTHENIEKMIHKIGRKLLSEGQLDESGISLKDFQSLIKSFTEMLSTIYHKRITYPDIETLLIEKPHLKTLGPEDIIDHRPSPIH